MEDQKQPKNDKPSEKSSISSEARAAILDMLEICGGDCGKGPGERAVNHWLETLGKYPPDLIRRAFNDHLLDPAVCRFFPKPGQIVERIAVWMQERAEQARREAEGREWAELERERREHPERFHSLAELLDEFFRKR
jgi:hypothetical protein